MEVQVVSVWGSTHMGLLICSGRSPVCPSLSTFCPDRLTCVGSSACFLPSGFSNLHTRSEERRTLRPNLSPRWTFLQTETQELSQSSYCLQLAFSFRIPCVLWGLQWYQIYCCPLHVGIISCQAPYTFVTKPSNTIHGDLYEVTNMKPMAWNTILLWGKWKTKHRALCDLQRLHG